MSRLPQTRHSLLIRLSQRSDDAWAEFLEVYEQAIFRYCRQRGLQDADAHDVTQSVLLAVHKRVDTWDGDPSRGSFRGWLFRAARNIVVDALADRSRQAIVGGGTSVAGLFAELPQESGADAFLQEYHRSLFEWAASRVQSEVHERTWKAFFQTAVEGKRPEDVARELGVSVGSVYTAKCRVVARLRAILSQLDGDADL